MPQRESTITTSIARRFTVAHAQPARPVRPRLVHAPQEPQSRPRNDTTFITVSTRPVSIANANAIHAA
jgi:hypothetical protein